jgi:hypothetical protein
MQMEPWMWKQMLWTLGFVCATYLPVQYLALRKCRGAARGAAALPLLVMVPMIIAGLQPSAYHSGSLYGMLFVCPYLPAMIYLLAMSYVGPRRPSICPHCGNKTQVRSFRMAPSATLCEKCGKELLQPAAADPHATPVLGDK